MTSPTGVSQICSGVVALGLIGWSFSRYHDNPEAVAELRREASAARLITSYRGVGRRT